MHMRLDMGWSKLLQSVTQHKGIYMETADCRGVAISFFVRNIYTAFSLGELTGTMSSGISLRGLLTSEETGYILTTGCSGTTVTSFEEIACCE